MSTLTDHPVRTDADLQKAMARIHRLAADDPEPGTPQGDELEVLSLLVRAYEDQHVPIEKPSLAEVVEFRAEQMGLSSADLDDIFGGRGRRSEVLSGKRELSKKMAARLQQIGVPDPLLLHLLIRGSKPGKSADRAANKRPRGERTRRAVPKAPAKKKTAGRSR